MASEPHQDEDQDQQRREHAANADATHREAYEYWDYLLKPDKCGTELLDRLLQGIAKVISNKFEPSDSPDLTPSQIAAWYRDVGGDYDVLFKQTPPSSIAFIYRSLGAFHSLQPGPNDDGYSTPAVPALKKQGFVTWQTIQLLLGPEEHVPFLQRSVAQYNVVDPSSGNIFPKVLPKECFPDKPDDAMETWYQGVAARLRKEADEEAARARLAAEPGPRTSTDTGGGSSADERDGAFKYFEDPLYRKVRRPSFMRHVLKQQAIFPIDDRGGKAVTSRVRHMLNPFNGRRKSIPGRYESDSTSDGDATPIAVNPSQPRYSPHKRPHPPRRAESFPSTDSDSEGDGPPSRRRSPDLRPRGSHEPVAPREYFPAYYEGDGRNSYQYYPGSRPSSKAASPQPTYGPTKSPLFATHVAQMEARNYHDRRPSMPPRTSYRPVPQNVRWGGPSVSVSPARKVDPAYSRDHHRDRERDGDGEREAVSYNMGAGSSRARHRRRSTEDAAYPRERERERDTGRTRSHDRVKDDWDDGHGSRERQKNDWDYRDDYDRSRDDSRERERDRDRRMHRYVQGGVQDSVSGRRYAVASDGY
ncbi:hypothetical protein BDU57DRAFT_516874 [Ampelomyces quisqualis]|uniref:DUF7514 domain-containing protein n=1 Tax=Ampelomyces quisqualis TaxID=50730 RepID=A0A6A5QMG8_AMPQU|nr:hypothetical protein BDU57DRAFT_516874 [Ampelomyces quisqualis]